MRMRASSTESPGSWQTKGFTLLELMVVVVIVGILAGIAYPSYQESVRKTKRAEGKSALMETLQQQERYYSQHNTYAAFSSSSPDKLFKWHSGGSPSNSAYELSAAACSEDTIINCVVVTAKPGTNLVDGHFSDPACGELGMSSNGKRTPAKAECWK